MEVILEIVTGPDKGKRTTVAAGDACHIGRGSDAGLQITKDPLVSRNHAIVECTDQGCRIRDLNSSNGTFVNGKRVSEATIDGRAEIQIGDTMLVANIEMLRAAAQPVRPKPAPRPRHAGMPEQATRPPGRPVAQAVTNPEAENPTAPTMPTTPTASTLNLRDIDLGTRRPYAQALTDEDAGVREAALYAAVWAREQWVLEYGRKATRRPSLENWNAILLFAILAQPQHLRQILGLIEFTELGARRYEPLGKFGHPGVVPTLLEAMKSDDPETAVAAGAAFAKITGLEIESETVVQVPAEEVEEVEEATGEEDAETDAEQPLLEEVTLPDIELAQTHWKETKGQYENGTRWCRGIDLSQGAGSETLKQLDMESRWEARLRARFEGTWRGSLMDLEAFPHGRG